MLVKIAHFHRQHLAVYGVVDGTSRVRLVPTRPFSLSVFKLKVSVLSQNRQLANDLVNHAACLVVDRSVMIWAMRSVVGRGVNTMIFQSD